MNYCIKISSLAIIGGLFLGTLASAQVETYGDLTYQISQGYTISPANNEGENFIVRHRLGDYAT